MGDPYVYAVLWGPIFGSSGLRDLDLGLENWDGVQG